MSNYYEILGVWRDASPDDIDLAAQALSDHWQGALALHDPSAGDWLRIIEQARATLIDPQTRGAYDQQLAASAQEEEEEGPVYSPGFPWRPYVCALLSVPALFAALILVLDAIANHASLTDTLAFRDALQTTMFVASAVVFSCGLVVLLIATRARNEQHRLRLLVIEDDVDPMTLAELEASGRMSEYTDAAVWVIWGAVLVVVVLWVWLAVLALGIA